jgi:hypothetical protein
MIDILAPLLVILMVLYGINFIWTRFGKKELDESPKPNLTK